MAENMTQKERLRRLDYISGTAAAQHRPYEPDTEFWGAVVNAWFLCDLIRINDRSEANAVDILRYSAPIVWC